MNRFEAKNANVLMRYNRPTGNLIKSRYFEAGLKKRSTLKELARRWRGVCLEMALDRYADYHEPPVGPSRQRTPRFAGLTFAELHQHFADLEGR